MKPFNEMTTGELQIELSLIEETLIDLYENGDFEDEDAISRIRDLQLDELGILVELKERGEGC